jgi:glycosyltransferase 2 family protein
MVILALTINEKTIDALKLLNPAYIGILLILWFAALTFDAMSIKLFVRGTGEHIGMKDGYKLSVIRIFFNVITPFAFGGQPIIVVLLNKMGIQQGKGSSIVLTRLLSLSFFFACGGIFAFIYFGDYINTNPLLSIVFYTAGIIILIFYAIAVTGLLFPPLMIGVIRGVSLLLHKIKLIKDLPHFRKIAFKEVHIARASFVNYFSKHFIIFLGGFFSTAGIYLTQIIILLVIFNSFNIVLDPLQGFASCALLIFLITFIPTPGASGIGDILFVLIFKNTVPSHLIGITVLLWRIFYQLLFALLGAVFSSKIFSTMLIKKNTLKNPDV